MSELPRTSQLLRRVMRRMRLAAAGRSASIALFVLAGVFAAGLLTARLSGAIPDIFGWELLAVLPAAAVLIGALIHRRPKPADAARAVDSFAGTQDLFLTTALLSSAPGEFHALVTRDAESRAAAISAGKVVRWYWQRRAGRLAMVAAALVAGLFLLPQLDPFGKVAEAQQAGEQVKKLASARQATEARKAAIRREQNENSDSKKVEKSVEELRQALNEMKPKARQENIQKIQERQKTLGKEWKQLSDRMLKELMAQKSVSQQFGGKDQERLQKWTKELQEGNKESLHKELQEMKEELERLAKTRNPLERQEGMQKLRKKLEALSELAEKKLGSKPLSAAIDRAMEQLEMAKNNDLSAEAMESLAESLDLTEQELEQIAQSAKDLKKLEQALRVCQMANKLNDGDKLDGSEQCKLCKSIGDYERLYEQLMAGRAQGEEKRESSSIGPGVGRGQGGGQAEDDLTKRDFQTEKSEAAISAGKVLLTLKTKGPGDLTNARQEYREAIRNVRQGTSEAIQQERIPPGYHDGIKRYFDSLEAAGDVKTPVAPKGAAAEPAGEK